MTVMAARFISINKLLPAGFAFVPIISHTNVRCKRKHLEFVQGSSLVTPPKALVALIALAVLVQAHEHSLSCLREGCQMFPKLWILADIYVEVVHKGLLILNPSCNIIIFITCLSKP